MGEVVWFPARRSYVEVSLSKTLSSPWCVNVCVMRDRMGKSKAGRKAPHYNIFILTPEAREWTKKPGPQSVTLKIGNVSWI